MTFSASTHSVVQLEQVWEWVSAEDPPHITQLSSSLVQMPMKMWHMLQGLPGIPLSLISPASLSSLRPGCSTNLCRLCMGKADTSKTHFCWKNAAVSTAPGFCNAGAAEELPSLPPLEQTEAQCSQAQPRCPGSVSGTRSEMSLQGWMWLPLGR